MCPELGDAGSSPPALGDCGHFCIASYKHAVKVLHLISNRVKTSNAYLHANHTCFLLLGAFRRCTVGSGGCAARAACSPVPATPCRDAAGVCLPVKTKKKPHKPLDFCFYQKLRFNLVFTRPLLLFPGRRGNGTPGPEYHCLPPCQHTPARAGIPAVPPLVSQRPQKPCGTMGTTERAWV